MLATHLRRSSAIETGSIIYPADSQADRFRHICDLPLSFPIRLGEGGFLERCEEQAAMLSLLQLMAATPGGSWAACPSFGLRDLLESGRQRDDVPRLAAERANRALAELGLHNFRVGEFVREPGERLDLNVYTATLVATEPAESFSTTVTTTFVRG